MYTIVFCPTNGDESHERREYSVKESGGENYAGLLWSSDEVCCYSAKQAKEGSNKW